MTLISSKSLTLPEFLSLTAPDGDITYELVDGEAIPKMSPKFFHSRLTGALFLVLDRWNQGRGEVGIEWAIVLSSPEQSFSSLSEKAVAYLKAGVSRVWIVDPRAKQITIFYPDAPPAIKKGDDEISDILLPDLTLTPRQIFAKARLS
ncbi:MAG: Uma2 family endonuclease [Microcystis aeruginosa W13-15]|nr:Uma2 family endonuclease [Microcystis aeruginosa W13-15]